MSQRRVFSSGSERQSGRLSVENLPLCLWVGLACGRPAESSRGSEGTRACSGRILWPPFQEAVPPALLILPSRRMSRRRHPTGLQHESDEAETESDEDDEIHAADLLGADAFVTSLSP